MNETIKHKVKCAARTAAGLALLLSLFSLSACAPLARRTPAVGAPLAEVTARLGQPNAVYPDPNGGQVLEYRGQPMGQFQYMARIGPDGRLLSYEQVLTTENFARVEVNLWSKDDILRHFGRPAEVARDRVNDGDVWSYRYKEKGVWNSLMNVYFNRRGIVLRMGVSADPRLDERFTGV
jgi:hypothetical protein